MNPVRFRNRRLPCAALDRLDGRRLLAGQHFGNHVLDAYLRSDGLRSPPVISRQHHDLKPLRLERRDRRRRPSFTVSATRHTAI
jgi:hypothetical protein